MRSALQSFGASRASWSHVPLATIHSFALDCNDRRLQRHRASSAPHHEQGTQIRDGVPTPKDAQDKPAGHLLGAVKERAAASFAMVAPMSIRDNIDARLRQARLDRDERTKNVINMVKNRVLTELKSGKDIEETDTLWLDTLAAYAKSLQKAIPEFEKAGERGVAAIEEARFELAFCAEFLPTKLSDAETEAIVRKLAAEHGIQDPKMAGKLMGLVMKEHKDDIEGATLKQVVARVLGT